MYAIYSVFVRFAGHTQSRPVLEVWAGLGCICYLPRCRIGIRISLLILQRRLQSIHLCQVDLLCLDRCYVVPNFHEVLGAVALAVVAVGHQEILQEMRL